MWKFCSTVTDFKILFQRGYLKRLLHLAWSKHAQVPSLRKSKKYSVDTFNQVGVNVGAANIDGSRVSRFKAPSKLLGSSTLRLCHAYGYRSCLRTCRYFKCLRGKPCFPTIQMSPPCWQSSSCNSWVAGGPPPCCGWWWSLARSWLSASPCASPAGGWLAPTHIHTHTHITNPTKIMSSQHTMHSREKLNE